MNTRIMLKKYYKNLKLTKINFYKIYLTGTTF